MARITAVVVLLLAAAASAVPALPTLSRAVARDVAAGFKREAGENRNCPTELKISNAIPGLPAGLTDKARGKSTILTVRQNDIVEDGEQCSTGKPMYLVDAKSATSSRLGALKFPIASRTLANNQDARAILQSVANNKNQPLVGFEEGERKCGRVTYPAGTFFFFFKPTQETVVTAGRTRMTVPVGKSALVVARPNSAGLCVYADETTARDRKVAVVTIPPTPSARPPQPSQTGNETSVAEPATATTEPSLLPTPTPNDGSACFPGSATVELEGGKRITMADLRIGDRVRTGPASFSDVFLFTHRDAEVHTQFVRLVTAAGSKVTLTKSHYLYANRALVSAGSVRNGDVLQLADGRSSPVSAIEDVSANGLYNPQTVDGNVVVDGIVTSAYTTAVHPRVAHGALLAPLRFLFERSRMSVVVLDALASFISQGTDGLSRVVPSGPAAFSA